MRAFENGTNTNRKSVAAYDNNGNELKRFKSLKDAATFARISTTSVTRGCKDETKRPGEYM